MILQNEICHIEINIDETYTICENSIYLYDYEYNYYEIDFDI